MSNGKVNVANEGASVVFVQNRYAGFLSLFWLWGGGSVALTVFLIGSTYFPSLGLVPGIVMTIGGSLVGYSVLALSAVRSAKYGLDEFITIRPTFGYKGALLGILILVFINFGWVGTFSTMTGDAMLVIIDHMAPGFTFFGDYTVYALGVGIIVPLILIILNPKNGFRLANYSVPVLVIFSIYIFIKLLTPENIALMKQIEPTNEISWAFAFEMCAVFGLSWFVYLGAWNKFAKSTKGAYWGTYLGLGVVGVLLALIGGMATLITGEIQPHRWAAELGFEVLGLIIVILGSVTTIAILLYSGAAAVSAMFPKWDYRLVACILGIPSVFLIYMPSLEQLFSYVLSFVGFVLCTYWAVIIADYFILRKTEIDPKECFNPDGIYSYRNGVNWVAFSAMFIGMIAWLYLGGWQFELSFLTFESGMKIFNFISASIPAMIISGVAYVILAKIFFKGKKEGGYNFESSK